ncbi:hypothetical protein PM082_019829 [Marasmius tenuissimus]|nr:hypothetical protein PM082_019829 [Marasmius tenuissimus]
MKKKSWAARKLSGGSADEWQNCQHPDAPEITPPSLPVPHPLKRIDPSSCPLSQDSLSLDYRSVNERNIGQPIRVVERAEALKFGSVL